MLKIFKVLKDFCVLFKAWKITNFYTIQYGMIKRKSNRMAKSRYRAGKSASAYIKKSGQRATL